jgi:hypothetical protein
MNLIMGLSPHLPGRASCDRQVKEPAILNASGSDGRYRLLSIEITVWRDTPRAAAASAWDIPR